MVFNGTYGHFMYADCVRENRDNIEMAAEATGSLITKENKVQYTEVGIFQLLY
jgi:hypothetical protein